MFSESITDQLEALQKVSTSTKDGKQIITPFLGIFQEFLQSLTDKFEAFKSEMLAITRAKDDKIRALQTECKDKESELVNLRNQLDSQDQYVRRESLIFSGDCVPNWKRDENCVDVICKLIPDKLGADLTVTPADISVAHRLGPKPRTSQPDRRSIIARFCRRSLKYSILNKSRKDKPRELYVNESLTPTRLKIVKSLKKAKQDHPSIVSGFQTIDGSIYAWIKPPNPEAEGARCSRTTINTLEALEEFCQKNFRKPASDYLPSRREATVDETT